MSFHRVLPLLPAISDQALRDRWAVQPDTLISSKIMTNKTSKATSRDNDEAPTSISRGSTSPENQLPDSPGEESLEDYESPKCRSHSLSQTSNTGNLPPRPDQPTVSARKSVVDKWQEDSPSSICLCQPDPKVPRPRNAFILYRQHNQAAVVAQNPGLANPEISKIIGDHWRNSSKDIKDHWKLLADEEKLRHQKLYPDYRYQPRRSIRNSSVSVSTPAATSTTEGGEPRRCVKCGGRSIATSSIMSGQGFSNLGTPYSPSQPPNSASNAGRFLRGLGSPPVNALPGYRSSRASTANVASLTLNSPRYKRQESGQQQQQPSPRLKRPDTSQTSPRSPEAKRRRITNASYAPVRAPNQPTTPFPFPTGQRRQSLPRADFMGPSANTPFTMGPPPRPPNGQHHRDASLTLAPLQSGQATSMGIDTQAKSLEAMILSIPTLGKIKVLSKISLPLGPPSPTSPDRKTRGLVIAVDAADQPSLEQLTHTLELNLSAYGVRTFTTPKPPAQASPSFQSYLRLIDQFHTLSAQVIDHITASPDPISSPMSSPSPVSPKSFPAPKASPQTAMPIAIVPGWQVTWSDWFASHVDIKDAYSPMDHWQWGATLWRNVVGADVTVAVQAPAASEDSPRKGPAKAGDGEGGEGGVKEGRSHEKGRNGGSGSGSAVGGVEVRLDDARAVIVKGEKDGGVAEGGLRRVGFEIGEWVRGWSEREERAARRGS